MATTPPGWYDDGHGALRWWDGAQWTAHVHAPDAVAPAGSPVTPAPAGYPVAPTPPPASNLWILWVVLGVVVLGLVVLALALIPLIIGWLTGGNTDRNADRSAAVASVRTYDQAWATADCDKFLASTTESFRQTMQITDCDAFVSASNDFTAEYGDYVLAVDGVRSAAGSITVETTESYTTLHDDGGAPLETPEPGTIRYTYTLVPVSGDWEIDTVDTMGRD